MLHFAYGSNMSEPLLLRHCPTARPEGRAYLPGHRFIIMGSGYASIVPAPGGGVHGLLWRLKPRDLAALNAYENLDGGLYRSVTMAVVTGRAPPRRAGLCRPRSYAGAAAAGIFADCHPSGATWQGSRRAISAIWRDGRRTQDDRSGAVDGTEPSAVADEVLQIKRLTIRGGVQGVGYRAFVEREAVQLGLTGWVRNRRDGTVEAVIAGPAAAVVAMIARCQDGPPHARVHTVAVEPAAAIDLALGSAGAFVIIATA